MQCYQVYKLFYFIFKKKKSLLMFPDAVTSTAADKISEGG